GADRHRDRAAGVGGDQVALQAVGGAQRDGAHDAVAELLLHFQGDGGAIDLQRVVHLRHFRARALDVDDRADDLNDLALTHGDFLRLLKFLAPGSPKVFSSGPRAGAGLPMDVDRTAAAPPTISEISCVIAAWRALL